MSGVSIKVAIRCRPFAINDKLGVRMRQVSEEQGETELINCDYSNTRFPFTYAWWSAYGYQRHLKGDNMHDADEMTMVTQEMVYQDCGLKIKEDVLTGNAVVMFAYGLSGSGKTFTVFGPDAPDIPEAWYKHAEPHPLWGIFPRLAYDLFKQKTDGWKITLKYFQNVVDIVRDLMSPNGEEQHYKNGMRKDPDGFMDIEWCSSRIIHSWNDLREQFTIANNRKAISSTQFNPISTRGHCIMFLEVEMPNPELDGMKQRGRLYVCDLAGTEPAGDIYYAQYDKIKIAENDYEYKLIGPHQDQKKTKELQDQGKKINLSLSEMAQFFMKMAEAFLKNKLTPGMSIPGCNSFFLCKYLKDTMLQARTYLFCAIRPEVTYLKYTFATLGFAKNASVVKLAPKKATVSASAAERKLMAELEAMKALVAQLQAQSTIPSNINTNAEDTIRDLQAKLLAKQDALSNEMNDSDEEQLQRNEQQRIEYEKRGISLVVYEQSNTLPYLINLDEDPFRSMRFMYILRKELTIIGIKGDIQPTSLSIVKDHCHIKYNSLTQEIFLIGGKGDTFHNGKVIANGESRKMKVYDRLAIGDQLTLLRWPGKEDEEEYIPMSAEDVANEYQQAVISFRQGDDINDERKKLQEERNKWEKEKVNIQIQRDEEEYLRQMQAIDNAILDLLPKAREAKQVVDLFNRITLSFDVVLQKGSEHIPKIKVLVENSNPKYSIYMDPVDFLSKVSLLKDELMKLRSSIEIGREYIIPERHDPMYLLFDADFHLGTATHWPEYLLFNLETDEEERFIEIKNCTVPYNTIGILEVKWIPLVGPNANEDDMNKEIIDIESEEELIGKSWTYQLEIIKATDLPIFCEYAYVQYDFCGETHVTEAVQQQTYSPFFDYKKIHHVSNVTSEFLESLKTSFEFQIFVNQHIDAPIDKLSTNNTIVYESVKTGEAKGYDVSGVVKPKSDIEIKCDFLSNEVVKYKDENQILLQRIQELETKLLQYESKEASKISKAIDNAKIIDGIVNGEEEPINNNENVNIPVIE